MKKHLIALAVASAVSVPAMAQNVSIYGIIDVNYSTQDTDNNGSDAGMGDSALSTSRLGFRGSEDLGGGLKAEFQLEGTLVPSNGTLGNTSSNGNLFNRESWVGVSGGFGHVRFGTTDVTNHQDIDTKVSQAGNLAFFSSEIGGDQKKTVRYISPNISGFQVEVGFASPTSTSATNGEVTAGGNNTGNVQGIYVQYENGPLGVYAGHASVKVSSTYDQAQTTFGAKYDFGVASVGLAVMSSDSASETTKATAGFDNRVLSVAVPLKDGYTLHGVYETSAKDVKDSSDFKNYTLAVTKALSKRTTLYGAYVDSDLETTNNDKSSFTVGLRHSF